MHDSSSVETKCEFSGYIGIDGARLDLLLIPLGNDVVGGSARCAGGIHPTVSVIIFH